MDRFFLTLASITSFAILCQWFVFSSVRKYLFGSYRPIRRRLAYPVLGGIALINLVGVMLAVNPGFLSADSLARQVATVAFFSYLGLVLFLSFFFLVLGIFAGVLKLKDAVIGLTRRRQDVFSLVGNDERGCLCSAPQKDDCKDNPPAPEGSGQPTSTTCGCDDSSASVNPPPTRRAFLKWSAATGLGVAGIYATHGIVEAYQTPITEEFNVFDPKLKGMDGKLTLIQATDFHYGLFFGTDQLKELVDRLNSMDGDALCITGDVFHSPLTPVETATPILKRLKPRRLGNFAVLGNHDFYTGEWRTVPSLKQSGMKLLRDQWVTITSGKVNLHLGGIDDPLENWIWGKDFPDFRSFMRKSPKTPGMKILLSHRPSVFPMAAKAGIDLVLSGHIHGGQIILPFGDAGRGLSLARIASPFTHGWYGSEKCNMYLSRGVGLTFIPWRINCPPEISVFHLLADGEKVGPVAVRGSHRPGRVRLARIDGRFTSGPHMST